MDTSECMAMSPGADGWAREIVLIAIDITFEIGEQHGIGVENLRGSGMIAGETSKSYLENFTLTFVSVGTLLASAPVSCGSVNE